MVPMAGVEPARLAPLPPQDSVSTSSTTSAIIELLIVSIRKIRGLILTTGFAVHPLVQALTEQVAALREELDGLRREFETFKEQFN